MEEREAYEYVNNGSGIPVKTWTQTQEIFEVGGRATINGRLFGNLAGLEMNEGERVRWYLFGLGSERDFHTAHWHGQRVIEDGRRRTDVVELLPASMKVADAVADNPGSWLFHCHVADHMREGMFARMIVHARAAATYFPDRLREGAFWGLPADARSLVFQRAVLLTNPQPDTRSPYTLHLRGRVSVFDAFSVFKQEIRLHVGGKTIVFKPDAKGVATTEAGALQIKNSTASGLVYGGLMEFEVTLRGRWLSELRNLRADSEKLGADITKETALPITLTIGTAEHSTVAQMAIRPLQP